MGVSLTLVPCCWLQTEKSEKDSWAPASWVYSSKSHRSPLYLSLLPCMSPKVPASEELSFDLNPFTFLYITIFITAPILSSYSMPDTPAL